MDDDEGRPRTNARRKLEMRPPQPRRSGPRCPSGCSRRRQKEDQPTGKKTRGIVARHLTRAAQHPRGIKVLLAEEVVGRVVAVLETPEVSDDDLAAFARVSNPQRGRGGGRGRRRRGGGGGDEAPRRVASFTG